MTGLPLLRVDAITKTYGSLTALDGVSTDVAAGEVVALLGLNGAGKTTLIRTALGMVRPDGGQVWVSGVRLPSRAAWSQVGYLVETPSAYPELSVRENLEVVRRLRKVAGRSAVDDAIDRFGLARYADRRARTLSLGNKQRLGLAQAMLHHPRLLVLDEPVNGLDPAGVVEMRDLLVDLARNHGTGVLVSSHLLAEVARAATRIVVLHEGRVVAGFPTADLARRVNRHLEVGTPAVDRARDVLAALGPATPDEVAQRLVASGVPLNRLAVVEEDLEAYFLRLVEPAAPTPEGSDAR